MRTTKLLSVISLILISMSSFAQMQYVDVYWPPQFKIYAPGDTFHLRWEDMDRLEWKIDLEFYQLKLHNSNPAMVPKYKTHNDIPHDFMYNSTLVWQRRLSHTYKQKNDGDSLMVEIPCETTWLYADPRSVQSLSPPKGIEDFINSAGLPTSGKKLLSNITQASNPAIYKMIIRGARNHVPGYKNLHFYTEIFFIDPDPNYAPEHLGYEVICESGDSLNICVNNTRIKAVDGNYEPIDSSRGPEGRIIQFFRFPDYLNNLTNSDPISLVQHLYGDFQNGDPTGPLEPLGTTVGDPCLENYELPDGKLYDVLAVRALRQYASGQCRNKVYDKSPLQPIVVFDFSQISRNLVKPTAFPNLITRPEVYSDQTLICDDDFNCQLPTTFYRFPEADKPTSALNPILNNLALGLSAKIEDIEWKATPEAYQGWTPIDPNEDYLTKVYNSQGTYQYTKVCWEDLENAYLNGNNKKEMTYEGIVTITYRYEGHSMTCTFPLEIVVTQNPQTANIVQTINQTIQMVQSQVPVAISNELLCDALFGFYLDLIETLEDVNPLRIKPLEAQILSLKEGDELQRIGLGLNELPALSQEAVENYNSILNQLGLSIQWDDLPQIQDKNSFYPELRGDLPLGEIGYTIHLEGGASISGKVILEKESLEIFPNPAQDQIQIMGSGFESLSILNMHGSVMETSLVNQTNPIIDLDGLKPGLYILRITTLSGEEKTEKLIIQ